MQPSTMSQFKQFAKQNSALRWLRPLYRAAVRSYQQVTVTMPHNLRLAMAARRTARVVKAREQEHQRNLSAWQLRIDEAQASTDNSHIPRHPQAGQINDGCQIMHNGLKIVAGSYYGGPIQEMLRLNRGVHEPQEERVFAELLPRFARGSRMLELGAYWSFYSMWFQQVVPGAVCHMVEPELENLEMGKKNFAINGMQGTFTQAFVGAAAATAADGRRTICVDDYVAEHGIDRLHMLHCDIQHYELDMLAGARRTLDAGKVDYMFISTHTNQLHRDCLAELQRRKFFIIAETDCDGSFSVDGLITACAPHIAAPQKIDISHAPRRSRYQRKLLHS